MTRLPVVNWRLPIQKASGISLGNCKSTIENWLELFREFASRTGNENPAGNASFTVFHPFDDASGLAALRAIRALAGVHLFLAIRSLCNLGHSFSPDLVSRRISPRIATS